MQLYIPKFFFSSYGFLLLYSVFLFHLEELFSIAGEADLLTMNSLGFCLSRNIYMLPSLLKDSLRHIEFLVDIFTFSTLNMSAHCFLVSMVSDEKSPVNLIQDPLYAMSHFSVAAFKISSLSLAFDNLLCVSMQVSLTLFCLEFVELLRCVDSCLSPHWGNLGHYFFECSFCLALPPSGTPIS